MFGVLTWPASGGHVIVPGGAEGNRAPIGRAHTGSALAVITENRGER